MLAKKLLLLTSLLTGGFIISHAQGFNDDDIYYNPAKDTKAKQEMADKAARKAAQQAAQYNNYDPTIGGHDFYGADAYQVVGSSTRDVDEYNRRGAYAPADSSAAVAEGDDFTYTRRIEKYHNGDIIADINDPELVEYYYASQPDVNIIINAPGYGWNYPWGYNYYAWNSPWYWNSWDWYWGPSWSWGWGYPGWVPSWSWGWGYPGWGPAWRPGWGYPGWGPSWAYRPGSTTGRRPVGIRNGYTGVGNSSLRPSGNRTPGRGGVTHESLGNYRPGSSSSSRPSYNNNQGGTYRPSNNSGSRPSNSNGSWGTTSGNRGNNNSRYNNNNNNYNSNRSYSAPSHSSPSRGGGYSGGGGGGGSHRGGRR